MVLIMFLKYKNRWLDLGRILNIVAYFDKIDFKECIWEQEG